MPAPFTGQVAITGSAQQLTTPLNAVAYIIKAPRTNTLAVYIGPSSVTTSNGYQLDPGETFEYEKSTSNGQPGYQVGLSDWYGVGTSGDKIVWFASP